MKSDYMKKYISSPGIRAFIILALIIILSTVYISYNIFRQRTSKKIVQEQYPAEPASRQITQIYKINLSSLENDLNRLQETRLNNIIYQKIPQVEKGQVSAEKDNKTLKFNKNNFSKTMAGSPGDPEIPGFSFRVLLPSNVDKKSITIEESGFSGQMFRTLDKEIAPVPFPVTYDENFRDIPVVLPGQNVSAGKNTDTYTKDVYLPLNIIQHTDTPQKGNLMYAVITVFPYQYNSVTRSLALTKNIQFQLKFTLKDVPRGVKPKLKKRERDTVKNFVNEEETDDSYDRTNGGQNTPEVFFQEEGSTPDLPENIPEVYRQEPAGTPDGYAIITTNSIVSNSQKLNAFITHKRSLGYSVYLATETQWGDGTLPAPQDRPDRIRQWLQQNYQTLLLDYVLLIGNPDPYNPYDPTSSVGELPMVGCFPGLITTDKIVPTDYYYAELTGNWNIDADSYYCEYPDDFGQGGVESATEVFLGRIAVYNDEYSNLDKILDKIIKYETEPGDISWRRKALLPMNPLNTMPFSDPTSHPGWRLGEELKAVLATAGLRTFRIYDENYKNGVGEYTNPELTPMINNVVQATWNGSNGLFGNPNGVGLVISSTHGSATLLGDAVSYSEVFNLDDTKPSFVFHATCFNASPSNSNNIAHALLKNGSIGSIATTSNGFYLPGAANLCAGADAIGGNTTFNEQLACRFGQYISQNMSVGEALDALRTTSQFSDAYNWFNMLSYNLYGDPSVNLLIGPSSLPTATPTPSPLFSPTPTIAPTGLMAYWDFDEGAGSTTADSSANGNHGTLINGPTWTAGRTGSALSFDGVDDYVNAGNNSSISNLTSFTWSAWIYPRSSGENDYGRIIGKNTDSGFEKALYLASSGVLRFNLNDSAGTNIQASSATYSIFSNKWQHVAVTFDYNGDKKPHLYINGSEISYSNQSTMSATPWDDSNYNLLIANRVAGDRTFNGIIDAVGIYNRSLTPAEISALAQTPAVTTPTPTPVSTNYPYKLYLPIILHE